METATLSQLYQIIRFESCESKVKAEAIRELQRRECNARCNRMGDY
ncbi:hypothetical protein P4H86_26290 [Bacillus cereus]|nr:hypothetical protein [Bacillus cereus]